MRRDVWNGGRMDKEKRRESIMPSAVQTEEPRNSAFQGTRWFYIFLQEMPYCQYIELKEKASGD